MIHAKNKNGFKKTTAKVENVDARRNILQMIKDSLNVEKTPKISANIQNIDRHSISNKNSNNHSNNNHNNHNNQNNHNKSTKVKEFKIAHDQPPTENSNINMNIDFNSLMPKVCESIDSSPKLRHYHMPKPLEIVNIMNIVINKPVRKDAAEQYIALLQQKMRKLEQQKVQYCHSYEDILNKYNEYRNQQEYKQLFQTHKLHSFYHDARKIITNAATQLIQCRHFLIQNHKNDNRNINDIQTKKEIQQNSHKSWIDNINGTLAQCQQLLQVYRKIGQQQAIIEYREIIDVITMRKLQRKCGYQQKTIDLLRKQMPYTIQFNQIKLLRHQINRVSDSYQKLLVKFQTLKQHKQTTQKQQNHQNNKNPLETTQNNQLPIIINKLTQQIRQLEEQKGRVEDLLQILQINNQKQQEEIIGLTSKLSQEMDLCYKYKEEKEVVMEFLEEEKIRSYELERKIDKLEKIAEKNKIQNGMDIPSEGSMKLNKNRCISTAQDLCRELKPYPTHFALFMKIVTDYQSKISMLQQKICEEKSTKDKFKQWTSTVYQLLSRHNSQQISQQQIDNQLLSLYKLDQFIENCPIQKLLRQIKALSIGIAQNQISQMNDELHQYVITLKNRNQTIKEVEYEDGSSVAYSDTFTDHEIDL